jgi:hypothetical protein
MNDVFEPDYYWKVISYKKHGEPITESWLGVNESTNRNTDPDAIKIDLSYVKDLILKYYPLLHVWSLRIAKPLSPAIQQPTAER